MPDNEERKLRAERTLTQYNKGEPLEQNAVDLLADLMHLYGAEGFADLLTLAEEHYEEEQ